MAELLKATGIYTKIGIMYFIVIDSTLGSFISFCFVIC